VCLPGAKVYHMTPGQHAVHTSRGDNGAARHAANWLSLAAAPALAVMAVVTAMAGGRAHGTLCVAASHPSTLGGMVPMYALMSAFHVAPWLSLLSRRGRGAQVVGSALERCGVPALASQPCRHSA